MVCYASLLVSYTKTRDDTIYSFATLDSFVSWATTGFIILASILSHLMFSSISRRRVESEMKTTDAKEMSMDDGENLVLIVLA